MGWIKAGPGRPKGSKNKASKAWKDLVRSICEHPEAQAKLLEACLERPELMFKAAEFAYGKPRQTLDLNTQDRRWIQWPDGRDVEEQLAEAEDGKLPS